MPRIGVFTIASKNYLAYVRVLLASVARLNPEYKLYLCLADRLDGYVDPGKENYSIVQADQLGIPDFVDMTLRYDIMEFNTAVKPFMFEWLFANTDLDAVIYLDPDIKAYSRFEKIESLINAGASMVLTPHLTEPLEDGKNPNDHHMLQAGVFNLGFVALRRCKETLDYLAWWGRRLRTQCTSDLRGSLFVDQKWCDLAPCFMEHLSVLRDPGHNVAYWNLAQRKVEKEADAKWIVNGRPLVFFHFSGISVTKPRMVSKHQNRLQWDDIPICQPLFSGYVRELVEKGWEDTSKLPYAYGSASDDFALTSLIRWLYRSVNIYPIDPGPDVRAFLINLCNASAEGTPSQDGARVTRLMRLVYDLRPDVQAAYTLSSPEGRQAFVNWFAEAGPREYGFPDLLARPDIQAAQVEIHRERPKMRAYHVLMAADRRLLRSMYLLLPLALRKPIYRFWSMAIAWSLGAFKRPSAVDDSSGFLDQPADIRQFLNESVSNLMYLIWTSRPDLQLAFDLGTERGQRGFIDWYKVSVLREYGLEPSSPHPAEQRGAVRGAVRDAASWKRSTGEAVQGESGANLIGYAHTETGVGEHVRMSAASLATTSVPFGVVNFNVGVPARQNASLDHGMLMQGNRYRCNLFHVNADQVFVAICNLGPSFVRRRYNILYPFWELSKWPQAWMPTLRLFDEIWAPSRFIQSALAAATDGRVEYMPVSVTFEMPRAFGRAQFGLPEDQFLFLFTFDFLSYIERKNPLAAITAFKQAFPNNPNVGLVIKAMNVDSASPAWSRLADAIAADPRVYVVNRTMNRDEVLGLYAATDAFVSLHRAEGFGRGPAEAMYLGKPVIVTNYSGNTDFTLPGTACLVDYHLIPVEKGQYVHEDGQVWADPDVGHAAWFMRKLVDDEAYRRQIAAAGAEHIWTNFSPAICGAKYRARLAALRLI